MPITPDLTKGDVYNMYDQLLKVLNEQCEAATDPDAISILNAAAQIVSDLLTEENELHLQANTGRFLALTPTMRATNEALRDVQHQVASIATKIEDAGKVLGAIAQVLQLGERFL